MKKILFALMCLIFAIVLFTCTTIQNYEPTQPSTIEPSQVIIVTTMPTDPGFVPSPEYRPSF